MSETDIESVLRNWLVEAMSPLGQIADGVDRATWVARNFITWWRKHVDGSLTDAEIAANRLRNELAVVARSPAFDEALHELSHLQDALGDLRNGLGFSPGTAAGG